MPLGREVGLDPGDIVLDGDPCRSPTGAQSPNFWPWPKGWMDQDATWYGGSLGPGDIVHNYSHIFRNVFPTFQTFSSSRHFALLSSPDFHAVIFLHGSHAQHHF